MRFFDNAMQANDVPQKVTMDKSGANIAGIAVINAGLETPFVVRPSELPQQHRRARLSSSETDHKPMLNFKSFKGPNVFWQSSI